MDKAFVASYLHPLTPIPTDVGPKGRLQLPIKCLLCDIYGTLFISGSGDIGIVNQQGQQTALIDLLLARYGQNITAPSLLERMKDLIRGEHEHLRGQGIAHPEVVIENIWHQLLPDIDQEKLLHFAVEFEMIYNPVWPMPGVKQLLSTCRKNDIRLGIVSNAQFYTPYLFSWLLDLDAEKLGFDPDLTIYSFQYGKAKPSADLFEIIRRRLEKAGISSTDVAYIGNDMRNDIVPAHIAGFQTILFAGDKRSLRLRKEDPKCSAITPDMMVIQLDQLASYLQ